MTHYIMTVTEVGAMLPTWILRYTPESSTPFETVSGTEHNWFWDFVNGGLKRDGETLDNYTITIERET